VLRGLKVPTHKIDAPGLCILPHDDAWDHQRLDAEAAELVALALDQAKTRAVEAAAQQAGVAPEDLTPEQREAAEQSVALTVEEQDAAKATHPVARYLAGETRYQLDAPDQGPRGPACARDYLKPDAEPLALELRRIPWRVKMSIDAEHEPRVRWEALVKEGVSGVRFGAEVKWRAKSPDDKIPADLLDMICEAEGDWLNLARIAGACANYSKPLTESEGKR